MSPKEVLGAIGLWVLFLIPLALGGDSIVTGAVLVLLYFPIFCIVIVTYIVLAIAGGKTYYGRDAILQVFMITIVFAFAYLSLSWAADLGGVNLGILIAFPLALLHIELRGLVRKYRRPKDDELMEKENR